MSGMSRELSIDRLSCLPDEVICHILSFLATEISVSTSILAKRWRFLWAHVPLLDFQEIFFEGPNSDVISSVILQHKAKTMHTLRIRGIECNEHQLEKWISTAVERKIRNLHIDFDVNSIALLHRTLFTCKTVVNMRLDLFEDLPSTGDVCLPSLKKLHLSHIKFEDDEALPHLLSGCPLLQELILDYKNDQFEYIEYDLRYINISSSTLKLLEVKMLQANDLIYRIVIDAPALRCLRMDCDLGRITILKDMVSLVEAEIRFDYCHDIFDIVNNESSNVVQCFNRLRNINCLKISSCEYLKIIGRVVGPIGKFNNLTKLELRLGLEWHLLVEFLEIADNLQVLIVTGVCICIDLFRYLEIRNSMEPKQVPNCLISSLKTIAIKQPSFEEYELDLVRYLLRNSQVLERMEILPPKDGSTSTSSSFLDKRLTAAFKALQRIGLFERGSKACQLVSKYWTEHVNVQ